jgi:hypothetical protein
MSVNTMPPFYLQRSTHIHFHFSSFVPANSVFTLILSPGFVATALSLEPNDSFVFQAILSIFIGSE